jgi:protein-tyrosine phosphatase
MNSIFNVQATPENMPPPGTCNFRSLKGLPAAGGRRIADHVIVRSDQLHRLEATGWQVLQAMGIRTVCDLRSERERQRHPNRLPSQGVQQLALPMLNDVRAGAGIDMLVQRGATLESATAMMLALYRSMPEALAPHLPALTGLFNTGEVPVLIHCASGKDRTGFAVAVLLHALGVPRDGIMADYMASAQGALLNDPEKREQLHQTVFRLTGTRCPEAVIDIILGVNERYLEAGLEALNDRYGCVERYLMHCAAVDEATLARWRARWLANSPS